MLFGSPPPPPPPPPAPAEQLLALIQTQPLALAVTIAIASMLTVFVIWFSGYVLREEEVDAKLAAAEARRRKYRAQITNLTFRALKSLAMADGVFHPSERLCLEACAKSLAVRFLNQYAH